MLVTTARGQEHLEEKAKQVAQELKGRYIPRNNQSIADLCRRFGVNDLLVVTTQGLKCYPCAEGKPFVFHPNAAMLRIRQLLQGRQDPLQRYAGLKEGMSFLDCTLGLGADSIVASFLVGPGGKVVGVEQVPVVAAIVKDGLQTFETDKKVINEAMRRIQVICADHLSYLKQCEDNQFDVVFFDPMFESTVDASAGIAPLKRLASYADLREEAVREACRVAKRRVVLKDSRHSTRFERFGFTPFVRPKASHWYGIIDVERDPEG